MDIGHGLSLIHDKDSSMGHYEIQAEKKQVKK